MGKKKQMTRLEEIAEVIKIIALRIRIEYPNRKAARRIAVKELQVICDVLQSEIEGLK
jgi:hypothetical protein